MGWADFFKNPMSDLHGSSALLACAAERNRKVA
jgi:hypothetical protein